MSTWLRPYGRDAVACAGQFSIRIMGRSIPRNSHSGLCADLGVVQSVGVISSKAGIGLDESFNVALTHELLEGRPAFPDAPTAYRAVFRWKNRYSTR